jgi:hypothetical protein
MEPTNQAVRNSSVNKFLGVYGLSLVAVLVAAYFLFNTPAGIFRSEVQAYKSTQGEEDQLLSRVEGLTANLNNIVKADQTYQSSTNDMEKGTLLSNLQEYQRTIIEGLVDMKSDTAKYISYLTRKNAFNYITIFNSMVAYRATIASLEKSLQEKGGDATELLKTKSLLDACNSQVELYKTLANSKPASQAVVPVPTGGGGGGAKEAALNQQIEKLKTDLAECQKSKGQVPIVQTPVQTGASDEVKKAAVLFDAGLELYNKAEVTGNVIEKRGILVAARLVIEKSKPAYPDGEKLNKAIIQIDKELKRLYSIG